MKAPPSMRHLTHFRREQRGLLTVGWVSCEDATSRRWASRWSKGASSLPNDRTDSLPVAMVDEILARQLWSSEAAAVGQRIRLGAGSDAHPRTVIGVVRRVTYFCPGRDSLPMAHAPQSQVYQRGMYTVIRTA
jgi:hypothetical protein